MTRALNFGLSVSIILCYFSLIFACCYYDGNFHRDRPETKADWNRIEVFNDEALNGEQVLKEDKWIPSIANNAEHADGGGGKKTTDLISKTARKSKNSKFASEVGIHKKFASRNEMKTPRCSPTRNSVMAFPPIWSKLKVEIEKATRNYFIPFISKSKERYNESTKIPDPVLSSLLSEPCCPKENAGRENFDPFSIQHVRKRRDSERAALSSICRDNITNLNYSEEYKIWNNFSIKYQDRLYHYDEYKVTDDGLQLCNSSDSFVHNAWKLQNNWIKNQAIQKCSRSIMFLDYYVVDKRFTVYWAASGQYFTRYDYAVVDRTLKICDEKLKPESTEYSMEDMSTCNDSVIIIKHDDEYRVWNNFSIVYKNKIYDYTEYRILTDRLTICNSIESFVQKAWKLRNYLIRGHFFSKELSIRTCSWFRLFSWFYVVNKWLTVYWAASGKYLTTNDYAVVNGSLFICEEMFGTKSAVYTKEDMSMCDDSIITIKYDDEYRVWNNFSIVYKNKIYDYTEYRILTDRLMICDSTDSFVQNAWRLRNYWIKAHFFSKEPAIKKCSRFQLFSRYYVVNKWFTVYWAASGKYLTTNDYSVFNGSLHICEAMLGTQSTVYTKEDMSMCNDSIITIKYDDEYRIWKYFIVVYKNKIYDYTEYRILPDRFTICNSTDNFVQNAWKLRNYWIKRQNVFKNCIHDGLKNCYSVDGYLQNIWKLHDYWTNDRTVYKKCNTSLVYQVISERYTVLKDFSVRITKTGQILEKNEYGIINSTLYVCHHTLWSYFNLKYYIALLFILSLSAVCLVLLLVVYCSLPGLRTLPGMNIMSLSIAFMFWDINAIGYLSLRFTRVHLNVNSLCVVESLAFGFVEFSILTNAAVNVYHLKKTFCRNILMKSKRKSLKTFLRYSFFSWGVPVVFSAIEIILVKTDLVKLSYNPFTQSCDPIRISSFWRIITYILDGSLVLYIIITFIFTAYRIRQKLKAGRNMAQKSNTIKNRNSFVLLLKLSTTTGLTWFPGKLLGYANISPLILFVVLIIVLLSGVYVAIAFVFTRKNCRLLRKRYFSKKESQVN